MSDCLSVYFVDLEKEKAHWIDEQKANNSVGEADRQFSALVSHIKGHPTQASSLRVELPLQILLFVDHVENAHRCILAHNGRSIAR